MKPFLACCLLAILLYACKSEKKVSSDVLQSFAPPQQENSIDPTKDNVITGAKGTKIFLPANLFVHADGSLPAGRVEVVLEEFFSVAEFASKDLATMSDSLLLETGGMLHIKAMADGKELQVSKDKSYVIAFPGKKVDDMSLFMGDTSSGKMNWVYSDVNGLGGESNNVVADSSLYDKKLRPTLYSYSKSVGDINSEFKWAFKSSPDSSIFGYLSRFSPAGSILQELCENEEEIAMLLSFNKDGKVSNVKFEKEPLARYRQAAIDFAKSLPAFDVSGINPIHLADEWDIHISCARQFDSEKFKLKYTQYRDKAIQQIDGGDLKNYILSGTRFGWINCDRFINDSTEKTELWVTMPQEGDATVMAVFEDINSVLQGTKGSKGYSFPNVPLNRAIRIVAISYKDGKPLLSSKRVKVNKETIALDNFKEFSLKELETELNVAPK
jgi:hypothetical protein